MEFFATIEILSPIAWLLIAVWAIVCWYNNERASRLLQDRLQKRQKYFLLVESARNYCQNPTEETLREDFLRQLNFCWLYSSDEVIRKANALLGSGREENDEKNRRMAELSSAIRRDLTQERIKKTGLTVEDFR